MSKTLHASPALSAFLALSALVMTALVMAALSTPAQAEDRYRAGAPVVVNPALTSAWVMQLQPGARADAYRAEGYPAADPAAPLYQVPRTAPGRRQAYGQTPTYNQQPIYGDGRQGVPAATAYQARRTLLGDTIYRPVQNSSPQVAALPRAPLQRTPIEPQFLPQMVAYTGKEAPGTVVIDTNNRFLYLVAEGGMAKRYGIGVGKPGFEWAGRHKVTRKAEWPDWRPPSEMIRREAAKGHYLPAHMEGGPENPLGARAMYLGSTLYRIHGTNAPWTIGYGVSSGCIRMRNEDVIDLYQRVKIGTPVIVL